MRKRLVMVGIRGRAEIEFPKPTHGEGLRPYLTVRDAIGDLPDAGEFGETGIHNHEPTAHSDQMIKRFQQLPQGKRERLSFHDRLHPDKLSYTLRAGYGNFSPLRPIHHTYHRVITARRIARLQDYLTTSFGLIAFRAFNSIARWGTQCRPPSPRLSRDASRNKWVGNSK